MKSISSPHPACLDPEILLKDCDVRRLRRGGPGGQRRNKVETAVELVHRPSGITAEASERRNQYENLQVATRRLRILLAIRIRSISTDTSAAERLMQYCPGTSWWMIGSRHVDFPCVLAHLLDALAETDWNVAATAERAGCSSSQVVKLLSKSPGALARLNGERAALGLRRLHARS